MKEICLISFKLASIRIHHGFYGNGRDNFCKAMNTAAAAIT